MIEIRNDRGELAELYPGTSITIERNNPLFNDNDKLFEDITYSFKMPSTESNKLFFDGGHLVEKENKAYEKNVQCVVNGFPFLAGKIRYSFVGGDFDALLKVNFGSLWEKVKEVKLTDIFTNDILPNAVTGAFMKLVAQNPKDYPFSFFPIKNLNWDGGVVTSYIWVNNWNHGAQTFDYYYTNDISGSHPPFTAQSAYFKLKYILSKVFEYLGFKPEGSFYDDPTNEEIYIYNRVYVTNFMFESSFYFPRGYTIADFLKLVKLDPRLKIATSFDIFKGSVRVESANSQLNSNNITDLRAHISNVEEIDTPESNGYLLSLKPDSSDDLFLDPKNTGKHIATNKLIVGSGEKVIEAEGSTLKNTVFTADITLPEVKQKLLGVTLLENASIRFLRYKGMKPVAGSKVFPEAAVMELSTADANWYRFLNDSKILKISGDLPMILLYDLQIGQKIGFLTKESNYVTALIQKITFSLKNESTELVNVKIDCRTIVYDKETAVSIAPVETEVAALNFPFKAFFDVNTGIESVQIDMFYPTGTVVYNYPGADYTLTAPVTKTGVIKRSSDKLRGGGDLIYLDRVLILSGSFPNVEIRVFREPKHLIYLGEKVLFTYSGVYWYAKPFTARTIGKYDYAAIWIVF